MNQSKQLKKTESLKQTSWEDKMAYYFWQFRLPEQERVDSSFLEKELGITEEDRTDYQQAYGLQKEEILSHEKELQMICDNQGVLYEEIRTVLERALI